MEFNLNRALGSAGGAISSVGSKMMSANLQQIRDQRLEQAAQIRLQQTQGFSAQQAVLDRTYQSKQSKFDSKEAEQSREDEFLYEQILQKEERAHELEKKKLKGSQSMDVDRIEKASWERAKTLAPEMQFESAAAADEGLAYIAAEISQEAYKAAKQGEIIDMNIIAGRAVQKYIYETKYANRFENPVGENGTSFSGDDNNQSAAFVLQNTPPGADQGYLQEFMTRQTWGAQRQQKILDIIKPSTASHPTKGDVVDGYTFLGGDPNDSRAWKSN